MKILNFGSCNIDYVYKLDHIVSVGETEQSQSLSVFPGGKGLNQSISLARAGAEVYHAGCIGSDGGLLLETLTQSGVDLRYIKHVDEKKRTRHNTSERKGRKLHIFVRRIKCNDHG